MAGSDPKSRPTPSVPVTPAAPVSRPVAPRKLVVGKVPGKSLGKVLGKGKPTARPASRTPAAPRERMTLDGPWEWAFDRVLARRRAAEALAKQEAKQAAKRAAPRTKASGDGA